MFLAYHYPIVILLRQYYSGHNQHKRLNSKGNKAFLSLKTNSYQHFENEYYILKLPHQTNFDRFFYHPLSRGYFKIRLIILLK